MKSKHQILGDFSISFHLLINKPLTVADSLFDLIFIVFLCFSFYLCVSPIVKLSSLSSPAGLVPGRHVVTVERRVLLVLVFTTSALRSC